MHGLYWHLSRVLRSAGCFNAECRLESSANKVNQRTCSTIMISACQAM